jgi:hypothetical protein
MALTTIDSYAVMYSANQFPPRILLLAGGQYIGQLLFEADGTQLPPDGEASGQVNLYYHLEQFPHVLDLLETDATVSLLFNGSGGGFENGLLTTPEKIGSDQVTELLSRTSRQES